MRSDPNGRSFSRSDDWMLFCFQLSWSVERSPKQMKTLRAGIMCLLPVASRRGQISAARSHVLGEALKRFLLIFSDRIFDSSVERAIPSFSAAPDGPDT